MVPDIQNKGRRAAEYVRMSTEHQQYSTHNQSAKIREYAKHRDIQIVKTYADEGRSGLSIGGRAALQELIADVENGRAEFEIILVYDVSRWGRFQDADESAYYEYICRRAGMQVTYCAEQFENDGSPVSTIVKGVKRAMAGEYSRELSAKVFAGQCRLIENGFRQGGTAGFGLRRLLIDQEGKAKGELKAGEHKSLQTDRVILVPGPEEEIRIVNELFSWLVNDNLTIGAITQRLNDQGILTDRGTVWTHSTVRQVLTNEKYIGNNVYNRRSFKLKRAHIKNPPEMWVRKNGAFEGIVPVDIFHQAQELLEARISRFSDKEIIEKLELLYRSTGFLSAQLIDQSPDLPTAATVRLRFGSLLQAYASVGFQPQRDFSFLDTNKRLRNLYPCILERAETAIREFGGTAGKDPETDFLVINNEIKVNLVLARCKAPSSNAPYWTVNFNEHPQIPDLTVAVRLDTSNEAEMDYVVFPHVDFPENQIRISHRNSHWFESFRYQDLSFFYELSARVLVTDRTLWPGQTSGKN